MNAVTKLRYDAVAATAMGGRDRQEDAVVTDFPIGTDYGFAVLADGMGGHASGNLASNIVVTEMFSELKMQANDPSSMERDINATLHAAVADANACIKYVSRCSPRQELMGTTVVAPVLFEDRLYWISIGDSPLWHFRDGNLVRLNEDHSMAPEIDRMLEQGLMDADTARSHPDRECLTSVLMGGEIARIDYSEAPVHVRPGDIILAASDGLEFLDDARIAAVLNAHGSTSGAEISSALLAEISSLDDPDQDNVAFCLVRVLSAGTAPAFSETVEELKTIPGSDASVDEVANALTVVSRKKGNGSHVICISKKVSM
ncbi:MAG: protein phosphatase 2C domain-containing protein [Pseudomonadota bacterium]